MYQVNLINVNEFLTKYWQKQPLVIRAALHNFTDPIDEHELAGLAQEDFVDSRIIANDHGKWTVEQGPIEDFSQHCIGAWSLLVQGVDRYSSAANSLLNAFNFIPKWRIEDLMVSYSLADAGVGPHLDQYDVFIVQGKGSRRWQVGKQQQHDNHYNTVIPHPKLSQIEMFSPIIDQILYPGDMIYIPPGFPHNGVALEPCMNYSIGFRAPSQQDLITALADYAEQTNRLTTRFTDPDRKFNHNNNLLQSTDINRFKTLITSLVNSDEFEHFLGHYLTTTDYDEHDDLAQTNQKLTAETLGPFFKNGGCLVKSLEAKCLLMGSQQGCWTLFVNQTTIPIQYEQTEYINNMLQLDILDTQSIEQILDDHFATKADLFSLIEQLVANNAWYTE